MSDALVDLIVRAWCGVRDDLTWQRTTDPSEREWLRGKARAVLAALLIQSEWCKCGDPRDEHDAGIASCGMCPCQEYEPASVSAALPSLPDGWDWLQVSIPVDRTRPVDVEQIAREAADAARAMVQR